MQFLPFAAFAAALIWATYSLMTKRVAAFPTTAIGLFVAIPAVWAYNRFTTRVERLSVRYETFADEFSSILQRQAGADE